MFKKLRKKSSKDLTQDQRETSGPLVDPSTFKESFSNISILYQAPHFLSNTTILHQTLWSISNLQTRFKTPLCFNNMQLFSPKQHTHHSHTNTGFTHPPLFNHIFILHEIAPFSEHHHSNTNTVILLKTQLLYKDIPSSPNTIIPNHKSPVVSNKLFSKNNLFLPNTIVLQSISTTTPSTCLNTIALCTSPSQT